MAVTFIAKDLEHPLINGVNLVSPNKFIVVKNALFLMEAPHIQIMRVMDDIKMEMSC